MDPCKQTILFVVLISSIAGLVHGCACSKNLKHCANINQLPVDFQTAQEICKERGGRLSTLANSSKEVIGYLVENTIGHFWVGLHPTESKCFNGTSNTAMEFTNSETGQSCVPLCVSVSNDRQLTVRSCTEIMDGFYCEDSRGDFCRGDAVIVDNARCMYAPCEHQCTSLKNAYKCSCKDGFRPNARDPRRCDLYCATKVCDALCMRSGSACWCPNGFVKSDQKCEDIDECESNHGCAQMCENTIGSYKCACFDPYVLVNKTECAFDPIPFNSPVGPFTTPSPNYIAQGALSTPGKYIGLIIFIVVAVSAVLVLVQYLRSRKATVQESNPTPYDEC